MLAPIPTGPVQSVPILAVDALTARYGHAQILFGVSLTLVRGEVAALLGRNGAGKSTTLKAIMGLIERDAQALTYDGTDVRALPAYRIARLGLGYVPEERRIFTDLSVDENLAVGRQPGRDGRRPWTPERLFELFPNLAEMRHRRASQMSGGEQQMLTIARTLMGNPAAVLLDEPSEGLAPVIVEQMAVAVNAMKREGIAVLLSEQNLAFAAAVADRVLVIDKGVIQFTGGMRAFLSDPAIRNRYLGV
jgi:branched-chain amino acid transport system ATP-binding protein